MPARTTHTYLKTHQLSGRLLQFSLRNEDARLRTQAADARAGRAAKTLVKEGEIRVTLVALRKGTVLQTHQVGGATTIQVHRGRVRLSLEDGSVNLGSGEVVAIAANVPHSAEALSDCGLLITATAPEA